MNDLEREVRPQLSSLIKGRGRTFYREGQRQLAAWAVKTALVMELIVPDEEFRQPIEDVHYHEMFRTKNEPPPRTEVWLGAWGGAPHLHFWSKEIVVQDGAPDQARAYSSSLTVGHAVFHVVGHGYPDDLEISHQGWRAELSDKIWPSQDAVPWPPFRIMQNDDELWAFMRPFEEVPEIRRTRPR